MPRKPTPPPEDELAAVRAVAAELATAEAEVERLRKARAIAMAAAKEAGATGDHLADAAGINRRNVPAALRIGDTERNSRKP